MSDKVYQLLCKDEIVIEFSRNTGELHILAEHLIPTGYRISTSPLECIQNFDQWCANRILPLTRKNVKKICNALGITQDQSVTVKAALSRAYHCSTLTDAYWVKLKEGFESWEQVSLFRNKSSNILTPVSLCGRASSIFNKPLNHADMVVDGTFAKSWIRENDKYYLLKADDDSSNQKVLSEVLASNVISKFTDNVVLYEQYMYDDTLVSKCKCFTSEDLAYTPFRDIEREFGHKKALGMIVAHFPEDFAMLSVMTYLTGNEDLHSGNWGLLRDMNTGEFVQFAPLFDFNYCFTEDYVTSKGLPFLPETKIVDVETGRELFADELDEYEFDIVHGRTIRDAAIYYATEYLSGLKLPLSIDIPECYREEFMLRVQDIDKALRPIFTNIKI